MLHTAAEAYTEMAALWFAPPNAWPIYWKSFLICDLFSLPLWNMDYGQP